MAVRLAQAGRRSGVRPVDHRGIEPAGDRIRRRAGRRIDDRPRHGDHRAVREEGIARRHRDVDVGRAGPGQIQVVIDELAPGIHHPGDALRVRHRRIALPDDHIADHPRVRPAHEGRDPVGEAHDPETEKPGAGGIHVWVRQVVPGAVEGPVFDGLR